MVKEQFIGAWELRSVEFRHSDGQLTYPMGRDVVGMGMYTSGHFSGQIMRSARPAFTSGDQLKGTPTEVKSAFEGYIAYYGTYEINQEEGTVTHHVEGSLFQTGWVRLRNASLSSPVTG